MDGPNESSSTDLHRSSYSDDSGAPPILPQRRYRKEGAALTKIHLTLPAAVYGRKAAVIFLSSLSDDL